MNNKIVTLDDIVLQKYSKISKQLDTKNGAGINIANIALCSPSIYPEPVTAAIIPAFLTATTNYWELLQKIPYARTKHHPIQEKIIKFTNFMQEITRLPLFVIGAFNVTMSTYKMIDSIINATPQNSDAVYDMRVGLNYITLASAMYLRDKNNSI